MSKPILFALLAAGLVSSAAPSAHATEPRQTAASSLGIEPDDGVIAAIAAAPPSPEHTWGTIVLAWCESGAPDRASAVYLGEWGLREERWIGRTVIRRPEYCPRTISFARSAERLVVAVGSSFAAEVVVFERAAGGTFEEKAALTFDDVHGPSLDADENVIALGVYEQRTPVLQMRESSSTPAPVHVLHVRLLEPSTLRVVSARVFRGEHLLRPHQVSELAGHALRLLGGRLFIAVPDDEPRIVAARLPSLTTERERTFVVPSHMWTPFSSSIVLNRMGGSLLFGIDQTFVLSPALEMIARHHWSIVNPIAFDSHSRRVLATDGVPVTLDGYRVRVVSDRFEKMKTCVLFAHGRGVIIDQTQPIAALRVVP